jgi:hypothetical protein
MSKLRKSVYVLAFLGWFVMFLFSCLFVSEYFPFSFSFLIAFSCLVWASYCWHRMFCIFMSLRLGGCDCECCNRGVCFCDYLDVGDRCVCGGCRFRLLVDL